MDSYILNLALMVETRHQHTLLKNLDPDQLFFYEGSQLVRVYTVFHTVSELAILNGTGCHGTKWVYIFSGRQGFKSNQKPL